MCSYVAVQKHLIHRNIYYQGCNGHVSMKLGPIQNGSTLFLLLSVRLQRVLLLTAYLLGGSKEKGGCNVTLSRPSSLGIRLQVHGAVSPISDALRWLELLSNTTSSRIDQSSMRMFYHSKKMFITIIHCCSSRG